MDDFKKGICNTLIATSVAEEGLDVGEVDLIICFDICTTNPTRFIQRIGRTGRKRQGNVIILATEGKELANAKDVISNKENSNLKMYQHKDLKNVFYKSCPRIVPPEFNPKAIQTYIKIPEQNKTKTTGLKKSGPKKKADSLVSGIQDVRKFFQKADPKTKHPESNRSSPATEVLSISSDSEKEEHIHYPGNLDDMFKNLEKLRKNLGKTLPANVGPVKNIEQTIKAKTVSKEVKRYILEQQPDYLREKLESYEVLSTFGETSNPLEMTEEEKQLKLDFDGIKRVFGSKFEVEEFLKTQVNRNVESNDPDKYSYLFEGLEERDFFDDNTQFIEEMFAKISPEDQVAEEIEISDHFEEDNEVEFVESKYLSQQQSPIRHPKSSSMSTPLNKNLMKRMDLKFDGSPIHISISQTSFSKGFESTFEIPEELLDNKLPVIEEEKEPEQFKENSESISNIFGEGSTVPSIKKHANDDLFEGDFDMEDLDFDESKHKEELFENDDCFELIQEEDAKTKYEFASPSKVKAAQPKISLWNDKEPLVEIEEINKEMDLLKQTKELENLIPEDFLEPFEEENTPSFIVLSDSSSNDDNDFCTAKTDVPLELPKSPFVRKITDNDEISPCVIRKRPSKIRPSRTQLRRESKFNDLLLPEDFEEPFPEEAAKIDDKENKDRPSTPNIPVETAQSVYKSPFVKKLEQGGDKSPSAIKKRTGLGSLKRKLLRNEGIEEDESFSVPRKKSSRLIESDDESAGDSPLRPSMRKKRARIVDSDVEDSPLSNKRSRLVESDADSPIVRKRPQRGDIDLYSPATKRHFQNQSVSDSPLVPKAKKRIERGFVEDEAAHSGDDSSEGEQESTNEVSRYLLDSMIVNDSSVKDDSSVNMQAIYLKSLR